MKLKSLTLNNYRCFKNVSFDFDDGLNIIIGVNGTGKTELLFALEWVLYDFDFTKLKGKEATPYALNSELYRKLSKPDNTDVYTTTVKLEFYHSVLDGDGEYVALHTLVREETYFQSNSSIKSEQKLSLSIESKNGTTTVPLNNKDTQKQIEHIIPKKILAGILFDGERMKSLSNDDEESVTAIDGFITEITNVELMLYCKGRIDDINKQYRSSKTKLNRELGILSVAEMNDELNEKLSDITKHKKKIEDINIKLPILTTTFENARKAQKDLEEIKELIKERDSLIRTKRLAERKRPELLAKLEDALRFGYLQFTDQIFDIAENSITHYDVPKGLTKEAVESIIERGKCICGDELLTESQIERLRVLSTSLPPDNLSSTLQQNIDYLKDIANDKLKELKESKKSYTNNELEIQNCEKRIAEINAKNLQNTNERIQKSQKEYDDANFKLREANNNKEKFKLELDEFEQCAKELNKDIQNNSAKTEEALLLDAKISYATKLIKVLELKIEDNKEESLNTINRLLENAFQQISEEYDLGRRVYITKHIEQYKLITYFQDNYDEFMKSADWGRLHSNKRYKDYFINADKNLISELNNEIAILQSAESHSTGQRKTVTLSFVKAIMEYALLDKKGNDDIITHSKKEYPLLIDAPFSELSGENLSKFANELPNFNKQSIIMLDPDIYEAIGGSFEKYIVKKYSIKKSMNTNNTTVEVL